tara:strand:- start:66 stop:485 length:420 start_codon:yes stop_codon:yes gene_type:complete
VLVVQLILLLLHKVRKDHKEIVQFLVQLLLQVAEVEVEEHRPLAVQQMEDLADQAVVVLGTYQAQTLLLYKELVIHLQLVPLKEILEDQADIMDQLTLVLEVEVELHNQELLKEVVDQQVMELVMVEMAQQVQLMLHQL